MKEVYEKLKPIKEDIKEYTTTLDNIK